LQDSKSQVLVVDDDQSICDIVSRMLEHLGHDPVAVNSGQSAVDECQRRDYDLVLLDVSMPNMSGEQVYQTLRNNVDDLPVVFMTGYRTEELASSFGADQAVGFLSKPFPLAELRTTMDALLASG